MGRAEDIMHGYEVAVFVPLFVLFLPLFAVAMFIAGLIGVIATDSPKAYTLMNTGLAILALIGAWIVYNRHFG
jgi:hypothetical protein